MRVLSAVEIFIQDKRKSGLHYTHEEEVLLAFCRSVGARELAKISSEQILQYLEGRPTQNHTWRKKYQLLTRFFEFWRFRGVVAIIPMLACRPMRPPTFFPYVFAQADVRRLLRQAFISCDHVNCPLHGETLRMFLLFLYATGSRAREPIALRQDSLDLEQGLVSFGVSGRPEFRTIPIGRDLCFELRQYAEFKLTRGLSGIHFFQKIDGSMLIYDAVCAKFAKLLADCQIRRLDGRAERPRLSDLRASFAVHRVTAWVKGGDNLGRLVPALAAYMGKQDISDTDRILNLTPERFREGLELLAAGSSRPLFAQFDR